MSSMEFVWSEDDHGNRGWMAAGYPHFNPTSAGQFAHDCLEHFPRAMKHGQIADELLALGARLFLRVESGWWWQQRLNAGVPESFGRELEFLMRHIHDESAAAPGLVTEPALDTDMDDEIEAILAEGVRITNRELEYSESELAPYTISSPVFQVMGAWMRKGVRAAGERFKGRHPSDVMWMAECLDRDIEKYSHGEEGDRLVVRIHEKDMEYAITHMPTAWSNFH